MNTRQVAESSRSCLFRWTVISVEVLLWGWAAVYLLDLGTALRTLHCPATSRAGWEIRSILLRGGGEGIQSL